MPKKTKEVPLSGETSTNLVVNQISDQRKVTLDSELIPLINERDGAYKLLKLLPTKFKPNQISSPTSQQEQWEAIGQLFQKQNRHFEAIQIFKALYIHMHRHQINSKKWTHKGMPLVWISESYKALNYSFYWKKYLLLTLCEDVIREKGKITPAISGVYFRLAWNDLTEDYIKDLCKEIYSIYTSNKTNSHFPEFILQNLSDQSWNNIPSTIESNHYSINLIYLEKLIADLKKDHKGKILELIADYIFSSMPGCITKMRVKTKSSDFDLVCSMEGFQTDFRSEFGSYFICECKSWKKKANFDTMAKLCRVLDSTRIRFGILLTKSGITGAKRTTDASREQLKIFHERGIIIVDISEDDLKSIVNGLSLQKLLKAKYEKIRLDTY